MGVNVVVENNMQNTDISIQPQLNANVYVAQNELLLNHVFNRNAKKLLSNDLKLYELYKKVFNQLLIKDYSANATYQNGDFIWFLDSSSHLYLLKCIVDNNNKTPDIRLNGTQPIDVYLKMSGWENKNRYLTIFDYGIENYLKALVNDKFQQHENELSYHPFGKISIDPSSDSYIGNKLLQKDMSNIDDTRSTVFFPYYMQRLDAGTAILNGYMRDYGHVIEYDVILKLASNDITNSNDLFSSGTGLSANTLKLQMYVGLTNNSIAYQDNSKYFYNSSSMDIFAPAIDTNDVYSSKIGLIGQNNRNDYVNTYSAKIFFPKPFKDNKYMVFANSLLSYTNGNVNIDNTINLTPSANDIAICNKTRDSITLLDIAFPDQRTLSYVGHNATHGGLAANSFHCKVIGEV